MQTAFEDEEIEHLKDLASEAPVIGLVQRVIDDAVRQRASDIREERGQIYFFLKRRSVVAAVFAIVNEKIDPSPFPHVASKGLKAGSKFFREITPAPDAKLAAEQFKEALECIQCKAK